VLLAGEPGVGKSTLLLDVAARFAESDRALYVTGEESAAQVRLRAERIDAVRDGLYLAAETDLAAVLGHVDEVRPDLLVVDSVQTIASAQVDGSPGNVSQVREVAAALIRVAKERGIAVVLVGHVTKDGSIAGPRVLEHLVDVVLQFEGERSSSLRMVRATKNRYGPVDEVGCFALTADGITAVSDPSGLFVSRHHHPVPGSCVTVALEGRRPLPVEIQALVTRASDRPRRAQTGVDPSRAAMVLAVLQARAGVPTSDCDVFVATVGGARLHEPAGDLATALAIASATQGTVVPAQLVALGEIGLAGELRRVPDLRLRLMEAARLGFTVAVVPQHSDAGPGRAGLPEVPGLHVHAVPDLAGALRVVEQASPPREPRRPLPGI